MSPKQRTFAPRPLNKVCCNRGVLQYRCAMLALLWRRSFPDDGAARTNASPSDPNASTWHRTKMNRKVTKRIKQKEGKEETHGKKPNIFSTYSFSWMTDIHFHKNCQWPVIIHEMNSIKTKDNFLIPLRSVRSPRKTWAFAKRQSLSIARPWRLNNLDRRKTFHHKWHCAI